MKASSSFSSSGSGFAAGAATPPAIAEAVTSAWARILNGDENGGSPCCLIVRSREVDEEEENKGSISLVWVTTSTGDTGRVWPLLSLWSVLTPTSALPLALAGVRHRGGQWRREQGLRCIVDGGMMRSKLLISARGVFWHRPCCIVRKVNAPILCSIARARNTATRGTVAFAASRHSLKLVKWRAVPWVWTKSDEYSVNYGLLARP